MFAPSSLLSWVWGECSIVIVSRGKLEQEVLNLGFSLLAEQAPGEVKKDNHTQAPPYTLPIGGVITRMGIWVAFFKSFWVFLYPW